MNTLKSFGDFSSNESFTLTVDQLPEIGAVVDKIDYTEGDKIAFINFGNMRNIPVHVDTGMETETEEKEI